MLTIRFVLLLLALLCFVGAALDVKSKLGLQPLGLALLTVAFLLG